MLFRSSLTTLAISLAQGLPQVILVEDLCKPTEVKKEMVHIHQIRVGPSWMDPIVLFLKEDILPKGKFEADKAQKRLLGFGCSRTKSCTSVRFLDHICCAYTLR